MYLKSLSIAGFKSFAKKSELAFEAPITAIVGPNGSGKSNVAESFRFVLGEQSVKSMRGKRGEDLIWGGSESVSRGNRASVEVVLDNSKRQFPLDFDEVKIERVVHRDGQNEYILNGSAVRLKDIQELLSSANIGSTGHHIISQGEADRILSAGAKERREMIEDALGLKLYQFKKNEAERKLEKTLENVAQVESLRRESAPHLRYLEKQVQKIEKSLALQAELSTVYAEYLKREDTYLAHHHDRLVNERRTPAEALEAVTKALAEAKRALQSAEATESTTEIVSAEESLRTASQRRQAIVREVGKIEGQISYLERRLADRQSRAHLASGQPIPRADFETVLQQIEAQVEKVVLQEDVAYAKRALKDVVHRLKLLLEQSSRTGASTDTEQEELVTLKKSLVSLEVQLAEAIEGEDRAKHNYDAIKQAIAEEVNESRQVERDVFRLVGEQRELEVTLERIDRELAILDRDRQEFKQELQEAVALLGRAATRYFEYELKVNDVLVPFETIVNEDRGVQRERRHALEKMKIRLEELGIGATEEVVKEYKQAQEHDAFLAREIDDLRQSIATLEALIAELEAELHTQFMAGIEKISIEFNRFFILMFGGGEARLEKVETVVRTRGEEESEDSLEDAPAKEVGVELAVKLPNKRVKGLEMLSGGERALTSIALIFAMSQVNPPPFIILDETDAALDEANSRRYGDLIEALAKKSQLILITHNRETMSRAGVLYGVTMGGDGVSKLLSVKFDEAAAVAKA